jgi:hypothetical protein
MIAFSPRVIELDLDLSPPDSDLEAIGVAHNLNMTLRHYIHVLENHHQKIISTASKYLNSLKVATCTIKTQSNQSSRKKKEMHAISVGIPYDVNITQARSRRQNDALGSSPSSFTLILALLVSASASLVSPSPLLPQPSQHQNLPHNTLLKLPRQRVEKLHVKRPILQLFGCVVNISE